MRVCRRLGTAVAALGFIALAWTPPTLAQDIKRFRAVVHPENPAPTLANDVAAVALLMPTGTSLTTDGRRTGRDSGLVGGLQTARLTTALRDFQRGVVMAVPSVQQPPAGGGMPPVFVVGGVTNTFSYIPLTILQFPPPPPPPPSLR